MRILFIGVLPPHPGGASVSTGQLVAGFAESGCDVIAIAPITEAFASQPDRFQEENPKVRTRRFSLPAWQYAGRQDPGRDETQLERSQVEALVARQISEARPDLVISGRESFAPLVVDLAERYEIPSVLFVRGVPTSVILAGDYDAEQGEALLSDFRRFDRILCVAEFLSEGLRRRGITQVQTMPNSIRLEAFADPPPDNGLRRELGLADDDIVALIPANFHWRKRPRDIVDAAALALRQEPRLRYLMVGVGALQQETEEYCRSAGLADRFRFPGWVDYERMPAVYAAADMVLMASQYEGMARSYVEAMAAGKPLIAADSAAAKELISDGGNGVLYPVGDVQALADHSVRLAQSATLRTQLGRAGQETVQARTLDRSVPAYLDEFERLLRP